MQQYERDQVSRQPSFLLLLLGHLLQQFQGLPSEFCQRVVEKQFIQLLACTDPRVNFSTISGPDAGGN